MHIFLLRAVTRMFGAETLDLDQIMDRESFTKKQNKDKIKVTPIDAN